MTIHELLGMLRNAKGPTGKGEYVCQCPAHSDQHASLWVNEGDKGIILKCQAGCSKDAILRALNLSVYDLLDDATRREWDKKAARKGVDPRQLYDGSAPARSTAPRKSVPAKPPLKTREIKTFDSYEAAYGRIGKLNCCYKYTDANGQLLFEVARIDTQDGKTFRQHRPADPTKGFWPIICNVPVEIRGGTIYRLPEVIEAMKAGKMIYCVEGEKDADTLAGLGRCATTSPMGADHWQRGHSQHLRGADVVVIPDADPSGEKYCQTIVDTALDIARTVRVVRLRDAYPQLPDKGDITDLVELVGADDALRMLDSLIQRADPLQMDLYAKALDLYNNHVPGYCIENGCISKWSETNSRPLGTFVALPISELTKDDGMQTTKWLEIAGWMASGHPLPRQLVAMNRFKSMDWAMEGWGLTANIMPGNTVRDQLRSAITMAGAIAAKKRTIYTHTGWRRIGSQWCYLYEGGCIGAQGVSVELEPALTSYTLSNTPDDLSLMDAALTSFSLTTVIAEHVSVPMLALMYLAPLREFLQLIGQPPVFIMLLHGQSGTMKSTTMALALSHFGAFNTTAAPASFEDTTNNMRRKAFSLKDMPLLIDDYHPNANLQARRKMEQSVQSLSRIFGNLAGRGRMASDLTLQVSMPPRSLACMTGEEIPDVGDSSVARFYVVEMEQGCVPDLKALTELQQRAADGELRAAMRGYIEWLTPQAEQLPQKLGRMYIECRDKANDMIKGTDIHPRIVGAIAHLMVGLTYMLRFFQHAGLCDEETQQAMLEEYWKIILGNASTQARNNRDESAVQMFLTAVSEMLASKTIAVMDIQPGSEARTPVKGMAGYMDKRNYYFMAETVYGAAVHFYRDQDRTFSLSRAALFRQLRDKGIVREVGSDGKTTKVKRTPDGKNQRLLWIPRWRLDGGRPEDDAIQEKMVFTEVSEEDIPDEFK